MLKITKEIKRERERFILLLCNVCQLSSEKTDAVCRHGTKDSQQGHQMSVFNIDSIFSSSVRYPERYVLKPEIIMCRLKTRISIKKQAKVLPTMFSSCLLRDYSSEVPSSFIYSTRVASNDGVFCFSFK